MSRNQNRVQYSLDSGNIKNLSDKELNMILRATDELVMSAGRSMLTKVLKGSKEKKILEFQLDKCPAYGVFADFSIQEISNRVDWAIENGFIAIEYSGKLPMLIFTLKGWEIEKQNYTNELFEQLCKVAASDSADERKAFIETLKTRNRQVILLLLEKIAKSGTETLISFLEEWKRCEVKKVSSAIDNVINRM